MLDVLFWGLKGFSCSLVKSKLQFLIKKRRKTISAVFLFSFFDHQNPDLDWIRIRIHIWIHLKCWIRIQWIQIYSSVLFYTYFGKTLLVWCGGEDGELVQPDGRGQRHRGAGIRVCQAPVQIQLPTATVFQIRFPSDWDFAVCCSYSPDIYLQKNGNNVIKIYIFLDFLS